jgi:hypothetical protein
MPISSELEAYFEKTRKKRYITQKLDDIRSQVDPAFLVSFDFFRHQVLSIVEENPDAGDLVEDEVVELGVALQKRQRVHNLKKSALVIEKIS